VSEKLDGKAIRVSKITARPLFRIELSTIANLGDGMRQAANLAIADSGRRLKDHAGTHKNIQPWGFVT
jgi:hypothetical protein